MKNIENEVFLCELLGTAHEESSDEKQIYEKPALAVVKFMFESDITWGSFENNPGDNDGDNDVSIPDGWWD